MIVNRKKILIFIGLVILGSAIILGVLTGLRTDPVPPQIRAGWYLPQQDIVWTRPGSGTNPSSREHFVLSGVRDGPAPQFPALSPYCRYENYTQENTDDRYMIAVWYFYEKSRFLASREQLKKFLVSSGTITDIDLNFSGSLAIDQPGYTDMDSGNNDLLPVRLNTTGYESLGTAGLFFTVEISGYGVQPGEIQYSGNNEHYIVYYGTAEPASLASRIDILREIIGQTYTYDRVISAEPL